MRTSCILFLSAIIILVSACSQEKPKPGKPGDMVLVEGGAVKNTKSNYYERNVTIRSFYIGKYEVTQKEWNEIMGSNPSQFKGDNLPVDSVNWYDCVEYCNKRSIKEGLQPFYNIDKDKKDPDNVNPFDDFKWTVTVNPHADGYRLPSVAEWEYAAGGGQASKSYTYSGSDNLDEVAWYWKNSGDKPLGGFWAWPNLEANHNRTQPVGGKTPNELGLYDMSGNVREWCWDWNGKTSPPENQGRIWKGGGWIGIDYPCAISFQGSHTPSARVSDQGFRVCRSK
jgi:sulfatase modifying factor 1